VEVLSASQAGRSHLTNARVNQDSAAVWDLSGGAPGFGGAAAMVPMHPDVEKYLVAAPGGSGIVLAVADGHGSASYDKSHIGSAYAVALALVQCSRLLPKLDGEGLSTSWCETELPRRLSQQWRRMVLRTKSAEDHSDEPTYISRFGTTLAAALIGRRGLLLFHIGDGEIVVITRDMTVHRPVLERTMMLGNEVESLSHEDADGKFRVSLLPIPAADIRMVMMASDGVTNSFVDEHGLTEFAMQTLDSSSRVRPGGPTLSSVLHRAIARCSSYTGDDVSVAIAINRDQEIING